MAARCLSPFFRLRAMDLLDNFYISDLGRSVLAGLADDGLVVTRAGRPDREIDSGGMLHVGHLRSRWLEEWSLGRNARSGHPLRRSGTCASRGIDRKSV